MKRRTFLSATFSTMASLSFAQEPTPQFFFEILEPSFEQEYSTKKIQLTIDDGPLNYMEEIIEGLGENKATFYLVGNKLQIPNRFDLAKHALEQGHLIGNHSFHHPAFSKISFERMKTEITKTDNLIERIHKETGIPRTHKLFRFPYGDPGDNTFNNTKPRNQKRKDIENFLTTQGYETQFWDTDTNDWRHYSKSKRLSRTTILKNCAKANNEDIVLCHDKPITANHIIPFYVNSQEYELTLPQPNVPI